jgi:hypothetical protein
MLTYLRIARRATDLERSVAMYVHGLELRILGRLPGRRRARQLAGWCAAKLAPNYITLSGLVQDTLGDSSVTTSATRAVPKLNVFRLVEIPAARAGSGWRRGSRCTTRRRKQFSR